MKIIFAGGGTAGHIAPAISVAQIWREKYPAHVIEFIGTSVGLETKLVPAANFKLNLIAKVIVPRKPSPRLLRVPFDLFRSFRASRKVLMGADLLIGFGGYVSAPAYLAAKSLRVKFVVHEANAKPGFANRLGALLTPFLAVAQPIENGRLKSALVTGIPLRQDIDALVLKSSLDWSSARSSAKRELGFSVDHPLILAFFGSQGSVSLNKVIAESLPLFLANGNQMLHAVGNLNELPSSTDSYKALAYISEMAKAYLAADLIISRSGAISCSEINALGRYAIFIPLAIGNGEQRFNAQSIIAEHRGELLDQRNFTPQWVNSNLERLLSTAAESAMAGSDVDRLAAEKIISLMEHAMSDSRS
ncbi:MAG: UDP-N-acetylglucosamine--N-acetylmuramyl-(pentapeptide) pyrophosphoryl-undecaprenol N-acetylglucosamine transferase [Candidatus Planktophila sp.]|jgi:UDP-N-acetylglucosamine--N-acetylmuramyl-(pentapeptide) pyrophosphoryl-undecaprenol N-acetylglucosamine transferase